MCSPNTFDRTSRLEVMSSTTRGGYASTWSSSSTALRPVIATGFRIEWSRTPSSMSYRHYREEATHEYTLSRGNEKGTVHPRTRRVEVVHQPRRFSWRQLHERHA